VLLRMIRGKGFQSTCLREARPAAAAPRRDREHFNPRAYVRHDPVLFCSLKDLDISIHVPT